LRNRAADFLRGIKLMLAQRNRMVPAQQQGQDIAEFPNMKRWLDECLARPAVQAGLAVGAERRTPPSVMREPGTQQILFGNAPKTP
jgi:glutathione S-transferase